MKELHLDVEELEERIAPSLVGVNPPGQLGRVSQARLPGSSVRASRVCRPATEGEVSSVGMLHNPHEEEP